MHKLILRWLPLGGLVFSLHFASAAPIDELEDELAENKSVISESIKTKPSEIKPRAIKPTPIDAIKPEPIKVIPFDTEATDPNSTEDTSQKEQPVQQNKVEEQVMPVISSGIPEGFDDLLAPQLALVDVFYNGQPIVSTIANYTVDWVEFEKPGDLIRLLTDLKDPSSILLVLETRLPSNSELVCHFEFQQQCGFLEPAVVGIIFDESKFRVDLFVNPNHIQQKLVEMDKYLPPSTSGFSFINSISAVASGGEHVDDIHAIQLNSLLGYENYRLRMNLDNDSENQTRLDQISFGYDYRDIAYEIGSFKSFTQSSGFYTQRDFIGARVQTSLSSRTDLEQSTGSKLFVVLNEQSRIDVFKDGQLIDSRNYDAGNVQIDTRNFPNGAYDVELKITGISGREKSEIHFYSKTLRLPPLDESLYFLEVGFPEETSVMEASHYPKAGSHSVFRAGVISRYSENLGLSASLVSNSDDFAGEFGSFLLAGRLNFQNNYSLTHSGGLGSYYQLDLNYEHFILSTSYRKTRQEERGDFGTEYELLPTDSRQILLNMSVPLEHSTINFFARDSERLGSADTKIYGASWRQNIYRGSGSFLDFSVDATRDDIETRILVGFNYRLFSSKFNFNFSARHNQSQLRDDTTSQNHIDSLARYAFNRQSKSVGRLSNVFEVNREREITTSRIQSELNNEHGYGRIGLQQTNTEQDKRFGYTLNSQFNIVATSEQFAIGGNQRNAAGVMIDLESVASESLSFAVIINDVEYAKIDAGKSRFVALQPYQTYQIVLSPRGESMVNFDNRPKKVTLYPGNIEHLAWDIHLVKVVIMQVLDVADLPIVNSRIVDFDDYAKTDDLGWIQLRVKAAGQLKFIDQNNQICFVDISEKDLSEDVNFLSEKSCQ